MHSEEAATLEDVARAAGVSTASVSRALSGAAGVSAATREEILRVARQLNYTGNSTARALASGRTGRVAVTVPHVHAEVFARILAGAAETFHAANLSLILETTEHRHDRHNQAVSKMIQRGVDGALLMVPTQPVHELRGLVDSGFRFVVVDPIHPPNFPAPSVMCANASGAHEATEYLMGLGHRRIAVITGEAEVYVTRERLHGVRQALEAAGRRLDDDLVATASYLDPASAQDAARQLLSLPDPPTAIFAFNDKLAFGVLSVAHRLNITVPDQLSVIGFDDLEAASFVSPELTTMKQPLELIGTTAAQMLLQRIAVADSPVIHAQLPACLVVRGSTGPAAN